MSKVTIEDISRQTGLSRGTVSRALNDRPDISEQTKQRVLEACRQLNYVPSQAARSLATGRTFAVAVVVDTIDDVHATAFARGVICRAEAANYVVQVIELGAEAEGRAARLQRLSRERIDAVLFAGTAEAALLPALQEAVANRVGASASPLEGLACDVFRADYREAGRVAARHLLDVAGDSILYVHAVNAHEAGTRRDGFMEVAGQRGIDAGAITIDYSSGENGDDLGPLLAGRLEGVRGIAATDDFAAVQVMLEVARTGRTPGRDVLIVGQGNERVSARITPALTTVDLAHEEMGSRAMETVLQRLGNLRMDAAQDTAIAPLLIERASTRPR